MCTICAALRPFNDNCDYETIGSTTSATITEVGDALGSTGTSYEMEVGDTFNGTISSIGEQDWVEIRLTQGEAYTISLTGGSLTDPFLRLYDNNGVELDSDDDGGAGLNSLLEIASATRSGVYYVSAGAFGTNTGTYTLSVREQGDIYYGEEFTLDQIAAQLTNGFWENDGSARRAFDVEPGGELTVDIASMSAEYQQLARWALEAWTNVTGIEFREVFSGAQIEFQEGFGGDANTAYARSSVSGGVIQSSFVNVGTNWQNGFESGTTLDGYTFQTFVHEIGHALGLGHAGNYNVNATYGEIGDPGVSNHYANDSWQLSVMSYFDQTDNMSIDASRAYLAGTMAADIVAIQDLYGVPGGNAQASNIQAGNTVWGANSNIDGYLGDLFGQIFGEDPADSSLYVGRDMAFTVYDTQGRDTIDLRPVTENQRVDLRQEGISDVAGLTGNMIIARDTVIENFRGGSGNDNVTGNGAKNTVWGYDGNDRANLGGKADTAYGGVGKDRLNGGAGNDKLNGGKGKDILNGGKGNDKLDGGAGNDVMNGQGGKDTFMFVRNKSGDDTIKGFQANKDTIQIDLGSARPNSVDVSTRNGDTIIDYGNSSVTLEDVRLSRSDIDFDFV